MMLKAVVGSLEDVPEAYRELYKEQDGGGFFLGIEGIPEHPETLGLKTKNAAILGEKKTLQEMLDGLKLKFDGVDAGKYADLLKNEADREAKKAEEAGEWDKLRTQLNDQHRLAVDGKVEVIQGLEGQLDTVLRENVVVGELNDADAFVRIMKPHVMGFTKTIEENGVRKVIVVDAKGDRRLGEGGNDMTIKELVAEMGEMDEYAPGFVGSDATGGGASGRRSAGGGAKSQKAIKDMTEAEKTEFIDEQGLKPWQEKVAAELT